ncbi:MAG TPA: sigma-70 family RNA polymerase sigma factor [Acidimicrobiia bacterium]|nr:sigma-70 family RNA polymerase sigma factor [Acidimicrobiia bacterium]
MTAATAAASVRGGEVTPDLLGRAKAGDQQAFTEIVRHYDHRLRALAYRLLGDRGGMDDALQEAYVKAFRALPAFREDAALGTWLYQITYRACVDHQRREGRHRPDDASGPEPAATGASADPAGTAAARTDLARALAALPVDQRAAVLLVDAQGLDYDAAAAVLGVAPGTIASRLSRARAALRATLAEGETR